MRQSINYQKWADYQVNEITAFENPSYMDAAVFKIYDIYWAFNYGIYYLSLAKNKKSDEKNELLEQNVFLIHSLMYINFCVDYCWQLMFMFSQPDTNSLYNHGDFCRLSKTEDLQKIVKDNLRYLKNLSQDFSRAAIVENVFDVINKKLAETTIREKYNYIKHRGMYYYGLGDNNKKAFEKLGIKIIYKDINGNEKEVKSKNMLYRDEISLDELYLKLNDFYRCYGEQIDKLLTIIPSKYCCKNSKDFNVLLKCFNIKDIINE